MFIVPKATNYFTNRYKLLQSRETINLLSFEKSVNRNFFIPDKTSFVGNAGFVVDKQLELPDFQFDVANWITSEAFQI